MHTPEPFMHAIVCLVCLTVVPRALSDAPRAECAFGDLAQDVEEESQLQPLESELAETLQDARDAQVVMCASIEVVVSLLEVVLLSRQLAGALVDESHAVEVEHQSVGGQHATTSLGVRTYAGALVEVQHLRVRVHAILAYGEEELDVSVVLLQQIVVAPPTTMNRIDRAGRRRRGGDTILVEVKILTCARVLRLTGVSGEVIAHVLCSPSRRGRRSEERRERPRRRARSSGSGRRRPAATDTTHA